LSLAWQMTAEAACPSPACRLGLPGLIALAGWFSLLLLPACSACCSRGWSPLHFCSMQCAPSLLSGLACGVEIFLVSLTPLHLPWKSLNHAVACTKAIHDIGVTAQELCAHCWILIHAGALTFMP
jgi:hypothetical protein